MMLPKKKHFLLVERFFQARTHGEGERGEGGENLTTTKGKNYSAARRSKRSLRWQASDLVGHLVGPDDGVVAGDGGAAGRLEVERAAVVLGVAVGPAEGGPAPAGEPRHQAHLLPARRAPGGPLGRRRLRDAIAGLRVRHGRDPGADRRRCRGVHGGSWGDRRHGGSSGGGEFGRRRRRRRGGGGGGGCGGGRRRLLVAAAAVGQGVLLVADGAEAEGGGAAEEAAPGGAHRRGGGAALLGRRLLERRHTSGGTSTTTAAARSLGDRSQRCGIYGSQRYNSQCERCRRIEIARVVVTSICFQGFGSHVYTYIYQETNRVYA